MEKEYFLSGYCRQTDHSRTVTVVAEDGQLTEVDCCFETCVHAPACTVAQEIREQVFIELSSDKHNK